MEDSTDTSDDELVSVEGHVFDGAYVVVERELAMS